MAAVNFSVPEEVKNAFNEAFNGRNKSAIIASLMREAVERERRNRESHEAIKRVVKRRRHAPVVSDSDVRAARSEGRP